MAECLALELLQSADWQEDAPLVSSFLASPWFPLLAEALGSLKREELYMSHVHGVGHIERTMVHGAMCAWAEKLCEGDSRLLLTMCAYHDTGRICDYLDGAHGRRSAEKLASLTDLRGEDLREAMAGIEAHSLADRQMEDILASRAPENLPRARRLAQMLKDADGLDRVRIGDLDLSYLRRPSSRERGRFAQRLFDCYAALERARGLEDGEGFRLSDIRRVKSLVKEKLASGEGCVAAAQHAWDGLIGQPLGDTLPVGIPETEACDIPQAAQRYFGALLAARGMEEAELGEICRAFVRRFREQYGAASCARPRPRKGCGGFLVDSILFSYQYLYLENEKYINGVGDP